MVDDCGQIEGKNPMWWLTDKIESLTRRMSRSGFGGIIVVCKGDFIMVVKV